jgi:hypothetical protein
MIWDSRGDGKSNNAPSNVEEDDDTFSILARRLSKPGVWVSPSTKVSGPPTTLQKGHHRATRGRKKSDCRFEGGCGIECRLYDMCATLLPLALRWAAAHYTSLQKFSGTRISARSGVMSILRRPISTAGWSGTTAQNQKLRIQSRCWWKIWPLRREIQGWTVHLFVHLLAQRWTNVSNSQRTRREEYDKGQLYESESFTIQKTDAPSKIQTCGVLLRGKARAR